AAEGRDFASNARGIRGDSGPGDGDAIPKIETGDGVRISEQEVRRVAELANLALTEDEIVRMTKDLDGILGHMDKLNELDTSAVEPMAQVVYDAEETATLRADVERKPLSNAEALANAAVSGQGYFKVPRVIEK